MPFRRLYGAGPLHAISIAVALAIATYAFVEIAKRPGPLSFALFFGGAIIAHDLIAFPVYSLLDRLAGRARAASGLVPGSVNYVRVPALLSALAFLVWFPLILGLADRKYVANTGHPRPPYLERWLLLTAALFVVSGVAYALRRRARAGSARLRDADREP